MQEDALILNLPLPLCITRKQLGIFGSSLNGQGGSGLTGGCSLLVSALELIFSVITLARKENLASSRLRFWLETPGTWILLTLLWPIRYLACTYTSVHLERLLSRCLRGK